MQLGKTKSFCMLHHHDRGIGDVDPNFDDCCRHQDLNLPFLKLHHDGLFFLTLHPTVQEADPKTIWKRYMQLTEVEEAFRTLKGDLALRPLYHQKEDRIEAHIFLAFLAYCLHVTLGQWLRTLAPGLTTRSVLEKFAAVQMVDVHIPTSDGRTLILSRYTQPPPDPTARPSTPEARACALAFRRLVERALPNLIVLAFSEISAGVQGVCTLPRTTV